MLVNKTKLVKIIKIETKIQWFYYLITFFISSNLIASDFSARIDFETEYFLQTEKYINQYKNYQYLTIIPEYYQEINSDNSFKAKLVYKKSKQNNKIDHFDIREAYFLHIEDNLELRFGVNKVFWGVVESNHIVNVINQNDAIFRDTDEKLGQLMSQLSLFSDWGDIDFFILPHFRKQEFLAAKSRPILELSIDDENSVFQNRYKTSYAMRFQKTIDNMDMALSYFNGTKRQAELIFNNIKNTLVPHYSNLEQFGLETQLVSDDMLYKLEAINRKYYKFINSSWQETHNDALVVGFEYTDVGIFDSQYNLGYIAEYLYNSDKDDIFQDDLMLGLRLEFNNAQSSEILISSIIDTNDKSQLYNLEINHRISNNFKLKIEAKFYNIEDDNAQYTLYQDEDFINIKLSYYY